MPQSNDDSRLDRVEQKVDDLTAQTTNNHFEVMKQLEVIREDHTKYQLSQMEKYHDLDKRVERHENHFSTISKMLIGGGVSSIVGLLAYFKDTFFKH